MTDRPGIWRDDGPDTRNADPKEIGTWSDNPTIVADVTTVSPFGSWESPISAEAVTKTGLRFSDVLRVDGDDLYWIESRPSESGRSAIVRHSASGTIADVGPDDFNVRTRVHEYGGGAYIAADGTVFASDFGDQRLYRIDRRGEPFAITPEPSIPAGLRYADLDIRAGWAVGVREVHVGVCEPNNELVHIDLTGSVEPTVLASGRDFYSTPRISPTGEVLAWLEWDHPNMPWDGTELRMATFDGAGQLGDSSLVAGGSDESITQPEWAPDGTLHYASDRSGWWNIYRHTPAGEARVFAKDAEFGLPGWTFAMRRYCFLSDSRLIAAYGSPEGDRLVIIESEGAREIPLPFRSLGSTMATRGTSLFLLAGGPGDSSAVVRIDIDTGTDQVIHRSDDSIAPAFVSFPEEFTFDTPDGSAHAIFYPPTNPEYEAPVGEAPPLIVEIHGGPTGQARTTLNPSYVYWTSRGFAVVDVDYGGSSGYGREYRNRLRHNWGIVDVRDCALAAGHLAAIGRVDPNRLIIKGGSAGGYTALLAMALRDEFAVGASYYGIANLAAFAEHSHKFEAHYLDRLVGPYPEAANIYEQRSALNHLDEFDTPVILFQGLADQIVLPEQTEMMRDALVASGIPVACVMFEGEEHGFRDARNQIIALESELSFYGQILGFEPAGDINTVTVQGL